MEKLSDFYCRIRPGGPGWKPVAKQCPNVDVDQDLGLSIVAALFAAALIYSVLPLTGFIIFGETKSAIFSGAVAIVCGTVSLFLVKRLTRAG